MRQLLIAVSRSVLSLIGTAVTTASAIIFLTLFTLELLGFRGGPYLGILAYLVVPGFFALGLLLIPLGILLHRRRARRSAAAGLPPPVFPVIDLNRDRVRRLALILFALTVVNAIVLAAATYKGVEVMDSTEFCGTACHKVMGPEYTTYQRSPHARVKCVSCHIGPGAGWFVKSKLAGSWQVVAATFDLYPRPITTPVHNLRPARETCEQCHWPTHFIGDRLKVKTTYADDEANTKMKTVLLMRVGGLKGRDSQGIHWHVDPGVRIRYRADEIRETIYDVELTLPNGDVKLFSSEESQDVAAGVDNAKPEWRLMDCVDCHNRPTHIYRLPEQEIDTALALGTIDPSLPFIKREGARSLRAEYSSHAEARAGIASSIETFYRQAYPDLAAERTEAIARAGGTLGEIYCQNVFPSMKITWGTYPNHIGHVNFPGCFRCHDDGHTTPEGETISQDCSTCHTLLAMEESDPEILQTLEP